MASAGRSTRLQRCYLLTDVSHAQCIMEMFYDVKAESESLGVLKGGGGAVAACLWGPDLCATPLLLIELL